MILSITKEQAGKLFGGVKFIIYFKALLSKEERDLIKRYKVGDFPLIHAKKKLLTEYEVIVTVDKMVIGDKFVADTIEILRDYENELIASSRNLMALIEELRSFGGAYYLDITPDSVRALTPDEIDSIKGQQRIG
ncbi:MAG: hypothetical protein HDQ93_06515 [Desulfovibrio sp.]|nr:hypothetical protein [Desulfovibrio sp.]